MTERAKAARLIVSMPSIIRACDIILARVQESHEWRYRNFDHHLQRVLLTISMMRILSEQPMP
jgi:hypothetical protein